MPPEKPPKNKRRAVRHTPDQQPSLLDQLDLDDPAGENHPPEDLHNESPGHKDGDDKRAPKPQAKKESRRSAAEEDQSYRPPERPPEPLKQAYARYVEIVGATYNSAFSDAKRQAAFKEAAKAHGVRIADLKRYSTAAALGIPYQTGAEDGAGTEPVAAPLDPDTSETY